MKAIGRLCSRRSFARSLSVLRRFGMTHLWLMTAAAISAALWPVDWGATAPVTASNPAGAPAPQAATSPAPAAKSPVDQLIPWLLNEDRELREIAFSEVVFDATGKHVLPIDQENEVDQRVIKQISRVLDEVMNRMNAPESPIQTIARINEVSSHFEDLLRQLLNETMVLRCDLPRTAGNKIQ